MNTKLLGRGALVVGLILIAVAIFLIVYLVPSMKVFPSDVDTTRNYNLSYLTLLSAETMSFYRAAPDENPDLHITRNVRVEEVDGNDTLIREEKTILDGDTVLVSTVQHHALDRRTMAALSDVPEAWTEADGYWEREGLVIGWGIGTEQKDYVGWNNDTRDTVTLAFVEEQEHEGIDTYYFIASSEPMPIDPAHVAALGLPTSLSIDALSGLVSGLEFEDAAMAQMLERFLPMLMTQAIQNTQEVEEDAEIAVPLVYYYSYEGEYWVEPVTGVLIDTTKHEHRAVSFPEEVLGEIATLLGNLPGDIDPTVLSGFLPLTVNEFEYAVTDESVQDAIDDANGSKSDLALYGSTIPMILIVLGIVLVGGGAFAMRKPSGD